MEITGQQIIAAPLQDVWNALNNPEVLKHCLPGCEKVEQVSPEEFHMLIKAAVGPLRASFKGVLRLTEANPPNACVMNFEGQGGAVGFAKGLSSVELTAVAEGTQLSYTAKVQIGGKLAQVGSRLIDSVAKKMADDFFKVFKEQLAPAQATEASTSKALTVTHGVAHGTELDANASKLLPAPNANLPAPSSDTPAHGNEVDDLLGKSKLSMPTVPTWWLAPAALMGALIAILGSRFIH
jgi:carbon monoxide dehydrogenase subunit G